MSSSSSSYHDWEEEMSRAIEHYDGDEIKRLHALGADIPRDLYGNYSILYYFTYSGEFDLAKLVIELGADMHCHESFRHACERNNIEYVRFLIEKGFDVNYQDASEDYTPLICAAMENELHIAKLLLEHGADPNKDAHGESPLGFALSNRIIDMIKLLLENGASV